MSSGAVTGSDLLPEAKRRDGLESLVVAVFGLLGLRVGLMPISDNSAFVHIRTGIDLTRVWRVPTTDPYSFTAHGHPWVVQSWLASLVYGLAYRWGGDLFGVGARMHALVGLQGVLMAVLGLLMARLARTGIAVRTMASAGVATILGALYWSPRPLIFGLLGLALLITVVEAGASPWWLVPIAWVWVNTHGSFPLGLAWLCAAMVGGWLDLRRVDRRGARYLGTFVVGCMVAAINPLGARLLTFPLTVEKKASVFKGIVEWHSPNFQTTDGMVTLALVALALMMIARSSLSWSDTFVVVGFLAGALLSVRNIAPAAVVLAPVLGRALRPAAGITKAPGSDDALRARLNRAMAVVLAMIALLLGSLSLRGSGLDLSTYPVGAEQWMVNQGLLDPARHRVAVQDVVGCYLILVNGTKGRVFIDDRVDMYPVSVSRDYDALLAGAPSSSAILGRDGIDTVLWDKRLPLVEQLQSGGGWRVSYADRRWEVLTRI